MPISFEQPGAYAPAIWSGYGALQQDMANREYELKADAAAAASQRDFGYGGGYGGRGGGGHIQAPGGWGVGGMSEGGGRRGGGGGGDGNDLADQYAFQLALQQGQLTQAENMRLVRLQSNLGALDEAHANGVIDDESFKDARTQLLTGIDPLQRRHAAMTVRIQEQQEQRLADMHAKQTAIQEEDAKFRARSLGERIRRERDPQIEQEVTDELSGQFFDQAQNIEEFDRMIAAEVRRRGGETRWFERAPGQWEPMTTEGGGSGETQSARREQAAVTDWHRHYAEVEKAVDAVLAKGEEGKVFGKTGETLNNRDQEISARLRARGVVGNQADLVESIRARPFTDRTVPDRLTDTQRAIMGEISQAREEVRRIAPNVRPTTFQEKWDAAKTIFQRHGSLIAMQRSPADLQKYTEAREWITKYLAFLRAESSATRTGSAASGTASAGRASASYDMGMGSAFQMPP